MLNHDSNELYQKLKSECVYGGCLGYEEFRPSDKQLNFELRETYGFAKEKKKNNCSKARRLGINFLVAMAAGPLLSHTFFQAVYPP